MLPWVGSRQNREMSSVSCREPTTCPRSAQGIMICREWLWESALRKHGRGILEKEVRGSYGWGYLKVGRYLTCCGLYSFQEVLLLLRLFTGLERKARGVVSIREPAVLGLCAWGATFNAKSDVDSNMERIEVVDWVHAGAENMKELNDVFRQVLIGFSFSIQAPARKVRCRTPRYTWIRRILTLLQ